MIKKCTQSIRTHRQTRVEQIIQVFDFTRNGNQGSWLLKLLEGAINKGRESWIGGFAWDALLGGLTCS